MNEEQKMVEEGFYKKCAELLGVPDTYRRYPYSKRTRWNNRAPGNGRFEGYGMIRLFGSKVHMALRSPIAANRWFNTTDEALAFLGNLPTKS